MNKLSPVVVRIVQKNAEILDEFGISTLPEDVQATASKALEAIVASVEAQGDDDPANKEQVREIWYSFFNVDGLALLSTETSELIEKIGSEEVQELLLILLPVVLDTLREVTDGNKEDNKEEIEKLWKELVGNPIFLTKVFALVKLLF